MDFAAGQYLNIVLDDGQRRAFSFANPPHDNHLIELHVRLIPGGRFTTLVFNELKVGDTLRLEGRWAASRCTKANGRSSSSLAPPASRRSRASSKTHSIAASRRPMRLYWGVRHRDGCTCSNWPKPWQREHDQLPGRAGAVRTLHRATAGAAGAGLVHEAMLEDFPDLSGHEVYACGSVKMVEAAVPASWRRASPRPSASPTPSRRQPHRSRNQALPACPDRRATAALRNAARGSRTRPPWPRSARVAVRARQGRLRAGPAH